MSRDYRPVILTEYTGLKFKDCPSYNVNIWSTHFHGLLFKALDLPHGKGLPGLADFPALRHEYKGADFQAVCNAVGRLDFTDRLTKAVEYAVKTTAEEDKHTFTPAEFEEEVRLWVKTLWDSFFSMFIDPKTVAVASDYCEQYY